MICLKLFGLYFDEIEGDFVGIFLVVSLLVIVFVGVTFYLQKNIKTKFLWEVRENENLKKWSSVGQMAGGIAHEVNTPLTSMLLTLENLSERLDNNQIEKAKKDVNDLLLLGNKIGNIVQSLRLLTMTGGKFERDRVSLFDVVIQVKNEFNDRLKQQGIDFAYMYNVETNGEVWGSSSALKHVLSNLVKNAMDALREAQGDKWIKLLLVESPTHYKLLVQNNGPHIDKNIAEKIFEPFFTTKDVGSAMGIGLSISKTLVLAHGGTIRVDTKNPHVMFEVAIPKMAEDIPKKEKKKAA